MIEGHLSEIYLASDVIEVNAHVWVSLGQFAGDVLHLGEVLRQLRRSGGIGMTLSEWKMLPICIEEIEANVRLPISRYEQCFHLPVETEKLVVPKTLATLVLHVLFRDNAWRHALIRPFAVLKEIILSKTTIYLPLCSLVIESLFILAND